MNLQLKGLQIQNIELQASDFNPEITSEIESEMNITTGLAENNDKGFCVVFEIDLHNTSSSFTLKLKAVAHFNTDEPVQKNFVDSTFLNVNAPAIAFPFIRTYISNITLNSGYNPIILNSVNFQKLFEDRKK
ncbi:MAG: protein-export chaperone SecB [Bacteroidales bacterium]